MTPPDSLRRRREGEAAGGRQLAARPLTAADFAVLTERVFRRVIGWFKQQGFSDLDSFAACLTRLF